MDYRDTPGERSRLNKAVRVLPPSEPHLQLISTGYKGKNTGGHVLAGSNFLAALLKLGRHGHFVPFIHDEVLMIRVSTAHNNLIPTRTSTRAWTSSHVADARSSAKLRSGMIVAIMCSRDNAESPGMP